MTGDLGVEYWLWLLTVKGVGPVTAKRLLKRFGRPQDIYKAGKKELLSVSGVGPATATALCAARSLDKARTLAARCDQEQIKLLTYDDPLYPQKAKSDKTAPILLFYRGTIHKEFSGVAIVGSRRCSQYGKEVTLKTAGFLSQNGITIISGMAKGIDSYAHIACLKNGGYTIAFLASGLDICYPPEHRQLMEKIGDSGALISEYPPGTAARAEHFPKRNRLISSWSDKIFLVEASEKSGALITADFAKKQKKEIFVLANQISLSTATGSNRLLQKGAKIFLDPGQLLAGEKPEQRRSGTPDKPAANKLSTALKEKSQTTHQLPFPKLSATEKKILDSISQNPKALEVISFETKISQSDLLRHLSIMELAGQIQSLPGGRYGEAGAGAFSY